MSKFKKLITPCILLIFGLFIHLLPMILNTDRMPGDLGDARLINYLLEHSFLWLTQNYPHSEFWSPPIFWPLNNTLAFSDILIGEMIIYIPIRFFIKDPQNAFQIFFVITNILNYAVFYIFSRKILKLEVLFASISAFFFAFNLPRYAQSNHIQLLAQFYMILPVMFLCSIKSANSKIKNRILFTFSCLSFVLLTYTTFYYAWFLSFGVFLGLAILFSFKDTRILVTRYFKNYDLYFLIPILLSVPLLVFLAYKYIQADINFSSISLIKYTDLLYSFSALDYFLFKLPISPQEENMLGIGILTQFFVLYGIFKNKYKKQILIFISAIILAFTCIEIFKFLYINFKFFYTIRAYGRVIFILVPVYSICIAYFFKIFKTKKILLNLFLLLFLFEQCPILAKYNWTKSEHIDRVSQIKLHDKCKVVCFETTNKKETNKINYALDIMWYANNKKIYSSSGYSTKLSTCLGELHNKCVYIPK